MAPVGRGRIVEDMCSERRPAVQRTQSLQEGKGLGRLQTMVKRPPRISGPTLRILKEFLAEAPREMAGSEIGRITGLPSGTLYPVLLRLEEAGWLRSEWERGDPALLCRPRRRFYRLTAQGMEKAHAALGELQLAPKGAAWA